MSNLNTEPSNENYQQRLDRQVSTLIDEWWNGLSKGDLLEFIRDNKAITADMLRSLFREQNVVIYSDLTFSTNTNKAQVDFNGESGKEEM